MDEHRPKFSEINLHHYFCARGNSLFCLIRGYNCADINGTALRDCQFPQKKGPVSYKYTFLIAGKDNK